MFSGGADFVVTNGVRTGPARFIFATLEGSISGWAPNVDATQCAARRADYRRTAVYTGLALGGNGTTHLLYAANFLTGRIDVFDGTFKAVDVPGGFSDRHLPRGFAPFGIHTIGGDVYVTYAKPDPATGQSAHGPGLGVVNVFDPEGRLLRRVATRGALNAPWGVALAPASFGKFGGALLVGNLGDGTINAYGPRSGSFLGTLRDTRGRRLQHGRPVGNRVRQRSPLAGDQLPVLHFRTQRRPGRRVRRDHGGDAASSIELLPVACVPRTVRMLLRVRLTVRTARQ